MKTVSPRRHHYHSVWRRTLYSAILILSVLAVGTVGFHRIEHMKTIDAFYMTSMIATAQGPSQPPVTALGKLFASLMAVLSVGLVVAAIGFLFGPFLGQLWRIGHDRWDKPDP